MISSLPETAHGALVERFAVNLRTEVAAHLAGRSASGRPASGETVQ